MHDIDSTRTLAVPIEAAGRRVDQVLAELLPEYSRSRLSAWLKSGNVLVDDTTVQPRHIVQGGERIELRVPGSSQAGPVAQPIALDLRYQDADVLVVNKPAGLVVHPGAGRADGTLQNALLHHAPELAQLPRAGIVHRLDKLTSGAMVVARSLRAHTALVAQLQARAIHRQYVAVVYGAMIAGGSVDAPIGRHPRDRLRQAVVAAPAGKPAVTHYRVRERFRAHTLVECRLETGRTHQIRVHMAHVRHPLVGDPQYSSLKLPRGGSAELVEALRGFRRQALHAEKLEFMHPSSGEPVSVSVELPDDLQQLIRALRSDAQERQPGR